jgi:hypothetical protein
MFFGAQYSCWTQPLGAQGFDELILVLSHADASIKAALAGLSTMPINTAKTNFML